MYVLYVQRTVYPTSNYVDQLELHCVYRKNMVQNAYINNVIIIGIIFLMRFTRLAFIAGLSHNPKMVVFWAVYALTEFFGVIDFSSNAAPDVGNFEWGVDLCA
jgi:hypothetical protein